MQTRRVINASGGLYFNRWEAERERDRLNSQNQSPPLFAWSHFVVDLVVCNTIIGYLVVPREDLPIPEEKA